MFGRGLDRFKKAQASEPFRVDEIRAAQSQVSNGAALSLPSVSYLSGGSLTSTSTVSGVLKVHSSSVLSNGQLSQPVGPGQVIQPQANIPSQPPQSLAANAQTTTVGGGASTWQPPEWAVDPRPGVYCLEVLKDGHVVDTILLDRKRALFGRQQATCDFVLDHPSLSRQHAAVVHHKNGSVYVIDLGSVHGTFVSNERLLKDIPVEIEAGQSLRFAASTRTYILRKAEAPPQPPQPQDGLPAGVELPPPPDPEDPDAVLQYNTLLNRLGLPSGPPMAEAPGKKRKRGKGGDLSGPGGKNRVKFRDQAGGVLVEIVGFSDGFDVATEPGPVGVREGGSLVGKFDSLVQTVLIPRVKTKSTAANLEALASPQTGAASARDTARAAPGGGAQIVRGPEKSFGVSPQLRQYLGQALSRTTDRGLYGSIGESAISGKKLVWAEGRPDGAAAAAAKAGRSEGGAGELVAAETNDNETETDIFGTRR